MTYLYLAYLSLKIGEGLCLCMLHSYDISATPIQNLITYAHAQQFTTPLLLMRVRIKSDIECQTITHNYTQIML